MTMLKKKGAGWPAGSDVSNVIRYMQEKEARYQVVQKATNENYPDTNLWLVAMEDSKHTSIMCNTWSTTLPKDKRRRGVGGELIEIYYSEYIYWYNF